MLLLMEANTKVLLKNKQNHIESVVFYAEYLQKKVTSLGSGHNKYYRVWGHWEGMR